MIEHEDIDHRSDLFVSLTTETLATVSSAWPRPVSAPRPVQQLLAESRRLFVGAASSYGNLVQSVFVGLQAAELALRGLLAHGVDEPDTKATLGQLLQSPDAERVLTTDHLAWYRDFALRFRNRLAHPKQPLAFSPGMADGMLRGIHEVLSELFAESRDE